MLNHIKKPVAILILCAPIILSGCSSEPGNKLIHVIAGLIKAVSTGKFITSEAETRYNEAESTYGSHRYRDALKLYKEVLKHDPEFPLNAKAYVGIGNSVRRLGRHEEAIEAFDTAIGLGYEDAQCYNTRGVALKSLKRYDEALESFDRAIELDPEFSWPELNKASVYILTIRYEEAVDSSKNAISKAKTGAAYNNLVIAYMNLGLYDESIQACTEGFEVYNDPEFYLQMGYNYTYKGNYTRAVECFDNALELEPGNVVAMYARARAIYLSGDLDKAIKHFDKVIKADPDYKQSYVGKGLCFHDKGMYEEAVRIYDKGLKRLPNYTLLSFKKCDTLIAMNLPERSLDISEHIILRFPDYYYSYCKAARSLMMLGRYDEALDYLDTALVISPYLIEANRLRAEVLEELGRDEEAAVARRRAESLFPDDENFVRAHVYFLNTEYNQALVYLNKALEDNPDSSLLWLYKASCYLNLESYDVPLQTYESMLDDDPDNPFLHTCRADTLIGMKRYDEALDELNYILRDDSGNVHARRNKAYVFHRQGMELYDGGEYREAMDLFEEAHDISPMNPDHIVYKAMCLEKQERYGPAIEEYRAALEVAPNDFWANRNICYSLMQLKKYGEALKYSEKAVKLNPSDGLSYEYKGYCLYMLGRDAESEAAYVKARQYGAGQG